MRVAIRGFIAGKLLFDDRADIVTGNLHDLSMHYTDRLLNLPGGDRHMIELEFLDEPDRLQRFFRFGTDKDALPKP